MACACCGRDDRAVVALRSREDVALCRVCVGWLESELGVTSTPTLPVRNMDDAIAFYETVGFDIRRYAEEDGTPGGFAFVEVNEISIFDLGEETEMDPTTNKACCYLVTDDADVWHASMSADGLPVTDIADQPWGMREYALTDPWGNTIRIGRAL
jgi:uncharacterized glyoxalase superfamily protein PhnB